MEQELPTEQPMVIQQDDELCNSHGKPLQLFCSKCSIWFCTECQSGMTEHKKHRVENVADAYLAAQASVAQNLAGAEAQLASLAVCEDNLQSLQDAENSMAIIIDTLRSISQDQLKMMTKSRKAKLTDIVELLPSKRQRFSELRERVTTLDRKELVMRQKEIEEQCRKIAGDYRQGVRSYAVHPVDDLECDLVPPYMFGEFVYDGCKGPSIFTFTVYDVTWNVTVSKVYLSLRIKLEPTDTEILKFQHSLIVIVKHPFDSPKVIRKLFKINGGNHTFKIEKMGHIVKHGFCKDGKVWLKLGIRPFNVLFEKRLLSYYCEKLKAENTKLRTDSSKLPAEQATYVLDPYRDHYISFFKLNLRELEWRVRLCSPPFQDEDMRTWCLMITLHKSESGETHLGARIKLAEGSPTRCNFFIELIHVEPQNSWISEDKFIRVDELTPCGWDYFISLDHIRNDHYHQNEVLRFRYGLAILPD